MGIDQSYGLPMDSDPRTNCLSKAINTEHQEIWKEEKRELKEGVLLRKEGMGLEDLSMSNSIAKN